MDAENLEAGELGCTRQTLSEGLLSDLRRIGDGRGLEITAPSIMQYSAYETRKEQCYEARAYCSTDYIYRR